MRRDLNVKALGLNQKIGINVFEDSVIPMAGIYPLLGQNVLVPFYDLVKGTSRFKCGLELNKTQWFSKRQIVILQEKNLRALLKHAYDTVPYYRRVFRDRGISPNDVRSIRDLRKLPILTKAIIRKNFRDLISRDYPAHLIVPYQSGGTGDQIRFLITKEQMSWEVAAEYRAYRWANYRLGDRCLLIWGSPADLNKAGRIRNYLLGVLERTTIADAFVLSNEALGRITALLDRFRPKAIRGYANSVYMLANYVLKHGIDHFNPRTVMTGAEMLLDHRRKAIEKAFSCSVFDYYGSREIGAIAAECGMHHGYHINAENVIVEFSKDGEGVDAGEDGLILATSLRNYGMPFIRYNMGDVGSPSKDACECGRGLPLMASIQGRTSDFMAVYDKKLGHVVPVRASGPGVFGVAMMHLPLERYQIIQESLCEIVIKVVKGRGYSEAHTGFLLGYVRKYLGDNIKIKIEFVDYLPPLPTGKRSNFISKINAFEHDGS